MVYTPHYLVCQQATRVSSQNVVWLAVYFVVVEKVRDFGGIYSVERYHRGSGLTMIGNPMNV